MSLGAELATIDLVTATIPERDSGRSHAEEILHRYAEVDAKLVAAGFPPTSPWWLETFARWYRTGRRQAVVRAGRRAGKSSSLSRLGVVEALYGRHKVPPGDTGVVALISTRREEAGERIATIKAILDALGVSYRPWGEHGVRLVGRRVGFRVYAASIAGVSGFTGIFLICDEVAKWRDNDTGANPATEVLSSVRPTMRTQPNARIVLSSSPMGMLDAHYDAFETGDTPLQITAYAPTWIANPTVTEDETRIDEPDESVWAREYAAVPQAEAESSLLSELLVDRAVRRPPAAWDLARLEGHRYSAAMDPATRGHAWTLIVATKGLDGRRRVVLAREWRGTRSLPLVPSSVLAEIAILLAGYGLRWCVTDQAAVDHLRDSAPKGLTLIEAAWTPQTKKDGYEHVLKLLQDDLLELHPEPLVKADLLGIRKRLTRNGVTYELAEVKGRHSDYAPALALAVDDARFAAKEPEAELSDGEVETKRKRDFLEGRRRQKERDQRWGRAPATHRGR